MKNQYNSFKLTESKNAKREIFWFIIITIIIVAIGVFISLEYKKFKEENEKLFKSLKYCEIVYENINNKMNEEMSSVDECISLLNSSKDSVVKDSMLNEMNMVKKYLALKIEIDDCFNNGIITTVVNNDSILYFEEKIESLEYKYKQNLMPIFEEMRTQYSKISSLINFIDAMYQTKERIKFKTNLTRDQYNKAVSAYEDIEQEELKEGYLEYIESAEKYLIKKEKEEAERKRQEEIKKAWVQLKVPYISQNRNNVFNGCEAASVLMGLKYKGYLLDMDIVTYSKNMPKSDDPNTGFYLDIFGKEPRNEAHWIAPAPLVDYAISSSGYNNVVNMTGASISSLAEEIVNGNPVVIYLTYDFGEPYNWSKGVPKNLHVQLLSGYNTITQQYKITDPFTRSNGKYEFILSKKDIEYLYNVVGRRAIVIR